MRDAELWTASIGTPGVAARRARRLEDEGWTGIGVVDSQCLSGDVYVACALAAAATSRLRIATAVTNSVTRHPATSAAAAVSVHAESAGRFVLGIGRGDSALAHLGLAPAPPSQFEHHLTRLRAYLSGADVPFDLDADGTQGLRSADTLGMESAPDDSRLHWLPRGLSRVPIDVAASGPKVIDIAARHADAVTFAVGVDPARLRWAIERARAARADSGPAGDALRLGTYVPLAVDDDRGRARELLRGGVGSYARFSVMHGTVAGPVDDAQRDALGAVHRAYDMQAHFSHGSSQGAQLDDDTIDAFAIAGPPGYCVERLAELYDMGLRRFFLMGAGRGADADAARASHRRIVEEVLPHIVG